MGVFLQARGIGENNAQQGAKVRRIVVERGYEVVEPREHSGIHARKSWNRVNFLEFMQYARN